MGNIEFDKQSEPSNKRVLDFLGRAWLGIMLLSISVAIVRTKTM